MDLDKLLKLVVEHTSEYFHVFGATLRGPRIGFPPLRESQVARPSSGLLQFDSDQVALSGRINPRLIVYALISILIGSVLQAATPGKRTGPDFTTTTVI